MALDATKGNRAKDNYSLTVEYSSVYNTNDVEEIRSSIILEYLMSEYTSNIINEKKMEELKEKAKTYKHYSDRELSELRKKQSERTKKLNKPQYEIIQYSTTDDNKVVGVVLNNKTSKTEAFLIELQKGETVTTHLNNLIAKLSECSSKAKTNVATVNKLRKNISILGEIEKNNK